jgi:hypothetical protein
MERMLKQPSRPTAEIIEWFAREMDWFSGMRDGKSDQYMWCAAADAAWYMLDLYLDDERKDKYDKYLNNC